MKFFVVIIGMRGIILLCILLFMVLLYCRSESETYRPDHRPVTGDYLPTTGNTPQTGGYADTGDAVLQTTTQLKASLCEECTSHCMSQKALQVGTGGVKKDRADCATECREECSGVI